MDIESTPPEEIEASSDESTGAEDTPPPAKPRDPYKHGFLQIGRLFVRFYEQHGEYWIKKSFNTNSFLSCYTSIYEVMRSMGYLQPIESYSDEEVAVLYGEAMEVSENQSPEWLERVVKGIHTLVTLVEMERNGQFEG